MTPAFADTVFYVAVLNSSDAWHSRAVTAAEAFAGPVITTEYVLLEVATFFVRPGNRQAFLRFVDGLQADPDTTVIPSGSELFARGLSLFASRPDKEWSLTDCISFAVMAERGLTEALTADHHFEQAGFRALLV